jgi:hypothetical protein
VGALALLWVAGLGGCAVSSDPAAAPEGGARSAGALPFAPEHYVAYRAPQPLQADGRLDEAAWTAAPWTAAFGDIEGPHRPAPRHRTRAKMLWDDMYFYIAAELEEPDLWATLTERDAVIFHDNDFEVFIDPDGDTHAYYELEVNALGTVWDLMLTRPYRDGGLAVDAWDVRGLAVGIQRDGTLNRPGDGDGGWTVELALPWSVLEEAALHKGPPRPGEQWRVNFSRVQWRLDVEEGRYVKRTDAEDGRPLPEDNWVWSPQGAVNMHLPERWGYVQFSALGAGEGAEAFAGDPNEPVKWALRQVYYRQRAYRRENGRYATRLEDLHILEDLDILEDLHLGDLEATGFVFEPTLQATADLYEVSAPGPGGVTLHLRHDGRVWAQ